MSFTTQVGHFATTTSVKLDRVRRAVCIKLFSAIILDTPVLTGRLRGNWLCVEAEGPLKNTLPGTDKAGAGTISNMVAVVIAATGERPTFLSNNLPYAARIEFDGHSSVKAPQGMVRINAARFNHLVAEENAKAA